MTEEMAQAISAKETEFARTIAATDKQLVEVTAKMDELILASQDHPDETEDDKKSAVNQVATERAALSASRKLLEELQSRTLDEAEKSRRE